METTDTKAKVIMVQGTMSNAGKSLLAAGLCRIFWQDGYRVCPFKSQNMALNSYITKEGLEMGRAQVMQAEAAGIAPSVRMNPVLLKPDSDTGSQVIVNGEVRAHMGAWEYYRRKQEFLPEIMESYHALTEEYDVIVIEGAGSPAEINLKKNDFVNMGMAKLADAPVLLVGDIDRGGVFAQLYGTVKLLEPDEQARIKGLVINKFRGDAEILKPGLAQLSELTGIPVIGTVPYMRLDIDEEDSLAQPAFAYQGEKAVKIAVIRTPRMSNFTDFSVFGQFSDVCVYYVDAVEGLHEPDMLVLPGTKSTVSDLLWMRQNGLEAAVLKAAAGGAVVFGVCGGFQMLGEQILDPQHIESGMDVRGMGLLPVTTVLERQKHRSNQSGVFGKVEGALQTLSGVSFDGYEIHHGRTVYGEDARPVASLSDKTCDGAQRGSVYGSYVHGIFDRGGVAAAIVEALLARKGISGVRVAASDRADYKQTQYDLLADGVRASLDMPYIYRVLGV